MLKKAVKITIKYNLFIYFNDIKMAFFSENTAHIDLVRDEELYLVYFILLPHTHCLPKDTKNHFNDTVDRSNMKSKVQDLVDNSKNIMLV